MSNKSVSIWGCCVSRDMFPEDTEFSIEQYVSFISPMSFFSDKKGCESVEDITNKFTWSSNFVNRCFKLDYTKTSMDFLAKKISDWLVFDIADARIELVDCHNATVTFSPVVRRNEKILDVHNLVAFDFFSEEEWAAAIENLCAEILKLYPPEKIILHECLSATDYLDYDGLTIKPFPAEYVTNVRKLLNRLNSICERILQGCHIITMPDHVIGDANHKWGLLHLHYHKLYYDYAHEAMKLITDGNDSQLEMLRELYSKQFLNLRKMAESGGVAVQKKMKSTNTELKYQQNIRNFYEQLAYDQIHEQHFETWLEANREKKFAILKSNDSAGKYMISLLQSKGIEIVFTSAKRLLKELSAEEAKSCAAADMIVQCCVHSDPTFDKYEDLQAVNIKAILLNQI